MAPIFLEFRVRPDGADRPDGHAHEEDVAPVEESENTTQHQSDDRAGDDRCHVYPESLSSLVRRKCIGQDRGAVGKQEGASDPLDYPERDELCCSQIAGVGRNGAQQRANREDHEAQVEQPHSPEHV